MIERAIDAILSCRTLSEVGASVLPAVAGLFDTDRAVFLGLSRRGGKTRIEADACIGHPDEVQRRYRREYHQVDPAIDAILKPERYGRRPDDSIDVFETLDRLGRDRYVQSAFYQTFMKPLGVHNILVVEAHLRDPAGGAVAFAIHRPEDDCAFTARDYALGRRLGPVLACAMSRLILEERLRPVTNGRAIAERDSPVADALTAREREIARNVSFGFTNREIAAMLKISIRTVENHLHTVYDKLGVENRTQLAYEWLAIGNAD